MIIHKVHGERGWYTERREESKKDKVLENKESKKEDEVEKDDN